jgi:NTP pyrophosphatase (non-canonical NTP hydrolase)
MAVNKATRHKRFADLMIRYWVECKLEGQSARGASYLMRRLFDEFGELWQAVDRSATDEVRGAGVRIANLALALTELAGALHDTDMHTEPLDFARLQKENNTWALHNFPERKPHMPLLGALEELGELSHSHLKAEQGIRGTQAEHKAKAADAIGDVIIYLADYCNQNGIDMQEAMDETWKHVSARDWIKYPLTGMPGA